MEHVARETNVNSLTIFPSNEKRRREVCMMMTETRNKVKNIPGFLSLLFASLPGNYDKPNLEISNKFHCLAEFLDNLNLSM